MANKFQIYKLSHLIFIVEGYGIHLIYLDSIQQYTFYKRTHLHALSASNLVVG